MCSIECTMKFLMKNGNIMADRTGLQYCFSIIIAAPTPPFTTSLSHCHRPLFPSSLFLPPLHLSSPPLAPLHHPWLKRRQSELIDLGLTTHHHPIFENVFKRARRCSEILYPSLHISRMKCQKYNKSIIDTISSIDQDKELK